MQPIIYEDESGAWDWEDVTHAINRLKAAEQEIVELKEEVELLNREVELHLDIRLKQDSTIKTLANALDEAAVNIEYCANNNVHTDIELEQEYKHADEYRALAEQYKD